MRESIALQAEELDRLFVRDVEEVGLPMGVGRRGWAIERNETNGLGAFVVVRFGDFERIAEKVRQDF